MPDRRQPTFDPDAAARAVADHLPEVATPVIELQAIREDQPEEEAPHVDLTELEKEDQKAREEIAKFEEQFRKLPPG